MIYRTFTGTSEEMISLMQKLNSNKSRRKHIQSMEFDDGEVATLKLVMFTTKELNRNIS